MQDKLENTGCCTPSSRSGRLCGGGGASPPLRHCCVPATCTRLSGRKLARHVPPAERARGVSAQVMRIAPYAVHPSYTFGGLEARRHRLREGQIWLDPPSYYRPARGLLTIDLHVPAVPDTFDRLRSDYMVDMHLKLVQHQLDQVRFLGNQGGRVGFLNYFKLLPRHVATRSA